MQPDWGWLTGWKCNKWFCQVLPKKRSDHECGIPMKTNWVCGSIHRGITWQIYWHACSKDLSESERCSWKSWLWAVMCLSGRATVPGFCPTTLKVATQSPQECPGWLGWTSRPFGGSFRMRSTPPKCWLFWQILAWTRSCFWACVWSSWWRSTWFIHSASFSASLLSCSVVW